MAIKYSLVAYPTKPGDKESPKKIYAMTQYDEMVSLEEFARHIHEHGSPFTRDVILGVLTAAVDCLHEELVAGNKVNFGDLGAFYVSLSSEGVDKAEDFNPHLHVKSIKAKWDPSSFFKDLKDAKDLKWEYTLTRFDMREAKKAAKEGATEAVGGITQAPDGGGGGGAGGE